MVSTGSMIVGQPLETNDQHFDSMVPIKINRTLYTMFDYDSRDSYVYWISVSWLQIRTLVVLQICKIVFVV